MKALEQYKLGIITKQELIDKEAAEYKEDLPTERTTKPTFRPTDDAFEFAIDTGRLSNDKAADNYAGHYMYMGTYNGLDKFKNTITREYI